MAKDYTDKNMHDIRPKEISDKLAIFWGWVFIIVVSIILGFIFIKLL